MELREKKLTSSLKYEGDFIKVYRDEVSCPNGQTSVREYIDRCPGAAILAITADQKIILEKQYRYALDQVIWEIPAGKCDPGEAPEVTAKRELAEETGYRAQHWQSLGSFYTIVGYGNEIIHLFLATGLINGEQHLDKDETLELEYVSEEEFFRMCQTGRIDNGITLAAGLRYLLAKKAASLD